MSLLQVPVTKGKGTVEIDTDTLPDIVYQEALMQGLKVLLNRGMTKITKETYPNETELHAAAMTKAEETKVAMLAGKIRIMGAKADKVSGAIMTEARRIAKQIVKDEMKRHGIKVSHVDAKDITAAANAIISANAEIVEQAKANIAAKDAEAKKLAEGASDIIKNIPINKQKVAKAEEEKAKAKAVLSATQAGKPKKQKPAAQPTAN